MLTFRTNTKTYGSIDTRKKIQKWLDNESCYLPKNHPDEYSTYAEIAYPIADVRRKYFENLCRRKDPSIGYKIFCLLVQEGMVNFGIYYQF